MANNSNRKAIEFMVQGALPPHSTNVLWMDTSVPTLPVLKIFENGAWTTVHTGDSKAVELLAETVLAQQGEITELTSGVAKESTLTQGVQNIREDISHIDIDTSDLAKETTLGTSSDTSVSTTIFGWLKSIRDFLVGIVTTNPYAKETSVKDGNDTIISVGKEMRSELGTGSDTASEIGTLFAVVKWAKDKVKSIYNAITDNTNGLAAIKQAIEDNAGVPTMTIPSTTASQELAPNVLYIFSSRSTALTLTLGSPIVGIANEYHFFLVTDSNTAPTITWPNGITWNGGSAPTIAADKTYEVSILNNVAAYFEV